MARRCVRFAILCISVILLFLAGFGAADAAPPSPPPVYRSPTYHRVRWGENLTRIAARYGTSVYAIARANGVWNINRIYTGQWLLIPSPTRPGLHVVRWGETLSGIAVRYHTTVWTIARMNGIWNIHRIYAGQRLLVPDP